MRSIFARVLPAVAGALAIIGLFALSMFLAPSASAQGGAPTATTASPTTTPSPTSTAAAAPTAAPASLPPATKPAQVFAITASVTQLDSANLANEYIIGVTGVTTPTTKVMLELTVLSGEVWVLSDPSKNTYQSVTPGNAHLLTTWDSKNTGGVQIKGNGATYTLMLTADVDPANFELQIQDIVLASAPGTSATPIAAPPADVSPGDTAGESDANPLAFMSNGQRTNTAASQALVMDPLVALLLLIVLGGGGAYLLIARLFRLPPFHRRRTDTDQTQF